MDNTDQQKNEIIRECQGIQPQPAGLDQERDAEESIAFIDILICKQTVGEISAAGCMKIIKSIVSEYDQKYPEEQP